MALGAPFASDAPDISYLMAAHDAAPWIEAAIASALSSQDASVEVVVVDDASRDDTVARARAMAARDPRVRVTALARNGGPAAARNVALDEARGAWIGILDADDLLAPGRSRRLLDLASETGSVLVADDAVRFLDQNPEVQRTLLGAPVRAPPHKVGLAEYLSRNRLTAGDANLGFLKPLVRADFLARHGLRYDERLRIGEDFNLCLRCLAAGTELTLLPEALYRYRVVGGSLSRRLKTSDLRAMRDAYHAVQLPKAAGPDLVRADVAYRRSIDDMLAWLDLRESLSRRDWPETAVRLTRPGYLGAAARTLPAILSRRIGGIRAKPPAGRHRTP